MRRKKYKILKFNIGISINKSTKSYMVFTIVYKNK